MFIAKFVNKESAYLFMYSYSCYIVVQRSALYGHLHLHFDPLMFETIECSF